MCETHCCARACVAGDTTSGNDGDEDDGVHQVSHRLNASLAVCDDEGGRVCAVLAEDIGALGVNVDGDHESTEEVEE